MSRSENPYLRGNHSLVDKVSALIAHGKSSGEFEAAISSLTREKYNKSEEAIAMLTQRLDQHHKHVVYAAEAIWNDRQEGLLPYISNAENYIKRSKEYLKQIPETTTENGNESESPS